MARSSGRRRCSPKIDVDRSKAFNEILQRGVVQIFGRRPSRGVNIRPDRGTSGIPEGVLSDEGDIPRPTVFRPPWKRQLKHKRAQAVGDVENLESVERRPGGKAQPVDPRTGFHLALSTVSTS